MRMLVRCCAVLTGLWLVAVNPVQAAEDARPPSERELRVAMNKAEKRFFEIYNRVNDDQRHEISCQNDEVTGSRLKKARTCRSAGENAIGEEAAREYLRGMELSVAVDTETVGGRQQAAIERDSGGPIAQATAPAPQGAEYANRAFTDVTSKIQEERAAFDQHLAALMDKHPELRQRLDELLDARRRYEAVHGR